MHGVGIMLAWLARALPLTTDVAPFLYICAITLVFGIVWQTIEERKRTNEIRRFAEKWRLAYLGNRMPATFRLDRTRAFESVESIRRAVMGTDGEKELVLLDCRVRGGRRRRWRTIFAARGLRSGFGWTQYGPDLRTMEAGDWAIVYSETKLMPIDELDTLMERFSREQ